MADQSDVEDALVARVSAALYPQGEDAGSVIGSLCRIYRGWPNAAALDADLAARHVNVTVFPVEGSQRNTTRWMGEWRATPVTPTLQADVSGETVRMSGGAGVGQLVGIAADGKTYVYRTQAGDTPDLVAAALAAQVRKDRIAQLAGSSITIPGAARLLARVVADAPATRQVRRQSQVFRITAWCPSPESRDAAIASIDAALAATTFLDLADGSTGRLRYDSTATLDQSQDAALYRRDLLYSVDYPTTLTSLQPSMLFGTLTLGASDTLA